MCNSVDVFPWSVASAMDRYLNLINNFFFNSYFVFDLPEIFINGKLILRGSKDTDIIRQISAFYSRNLSTEMTKKQAKARYAREK